MFSEALLGRRYWFRRENCRIIEKAGPASGGLLMNFRRWNEKVEFLMGEFGMFCFGKRFLLHCRLIETTALLWIWGIGKGIKGLRFVEDGNKKRLLKVERIMDGFVKC